MHFDDDFKLIVATNLVNNTSKYNLIEAVTIPSYFCRKFKTFHYVATVFHGELAPVPM